MKKYYFLILLINYSEQLFVMLPISQFTLIKSRLIQIILKHSFYSTKLQICEQLQACKNTKEVKSLLSRMIKKWDINDENQLALQLVEESANNQILTRQEIIRFIKTAMSKDPLYNSHLSYSALDLLVSFGRNKILKGSDILPLLEEAIDICGVDSECVTRVKSLVEANVLENVDKEYLLSFLRKGILLSKQRNSSFEIQFHNDLLDLTNVLQKNNLLTNNEKNSLLKEKDF